NFADFIHPDDMPGFTARFNRALASTDATDSVQFRIRHRDGLWRVMESTGKMILDQSGTEIGVVSSRDITERKHVEEELKRTSERLRALAAYIEFVREEERTGIAREIHDELGQVLTALKLDLAWMLNHLPTAEPPLLEKARDMLEVLDLTVQRVRRI